MQGGRLIAASTTALSINSRLGIAGPVTELPTVDLNGFNNQVNGLTGNGTGVLTRCLVPAFGGSD